MVPLMPSNYLRHIKFDCSRNWGCKRFLRFQDRPAVAADRVQDLKLSLLWLMKYPVRKRLTALTSSGNRTNDTTPASIKLKYRFFVVLSNFSSFFNYFSFFSVNKSKQLPFRF